MIAEIVVPSLLTGLFGAVLYYRVFMYEPPFVPLPHSVVMDVMEVGNVGRGDVLYDLGSGDGRVLAAAADRGASATGLEKNKFLVWLSKVKTRKYSSIVFNQDVLELDSLRGSSVHTANVVVCYLSQKLNNAIERKVKALRPGTTIISVSHTFDSLHEIMRKKSGSFIIYKYLV
jgi:hypothetical protein